MNEIKTARKALEEAFDSGTKELFLKEVYPVLLNTEKDSGLLENKCCRNVADGSDVVVAYCFRPVEANGLACFVNKDMATLHGIEEAELSENATENVGKETSVHGLMQVLSGDELDTIDYERPVVVTNKTGVYGASAILNKKTLNSLYEEMGEFYIIPSSKHEALVTKVESMDVKNVNEMCKFVNENEVSEADFLSNIVLKYNGKNIVVA